MSWRTSLVLLFGIAALLRLGFVLNLQEGYYFWDSVEYENAATSLLETGTLGPKYNRSPVYPLFLAAVHLIFGRSILAVRIVESFLGALIAILLALLTRAVAGEEASLLAGMIWAFYPLAVFLACLVYPETIVTALLLGGVLLLVQGKEQRHSKRLIVSGVLIAIASLLKPVAAGTTAGLVVWLLLFGNTRRYRSCALFLAGVALPLIVSAAGTWFLSGRVALGDPRALVLVDRAGTRSMEEVRMGALGRAINDPVRYARQVFSEFGQFWQLYPQRVTMSDQKERDKFYQKDQRIVPKTAFGVNSLTVLVSVFSVGPVFLFAAVGALRLVIDRRWRILSLLAVLILSFAVGYSFFFNQMRYRIPVEPYIILLAAFGFVHTAAILRRPLIGFLTGWGGTSRARVPNTTAKMN